VSVVTDYPDFSPHVATAQQVAATGVPLLTLSNRLYQQATPNLAHGAVAGSGHLAVTQIGYEVLINAQFQAGTANPFCQVDLVWTDTITGFVIGFDTYYVPGATRSGGWLTVGRGPTKANQLDVNVTNLDTVNPVTLGVTVLQNSRVYPTDIWRWRNDANAGAVIPGFTLPTLPSDTALLGAVNSASIPASSTVTWLAGMAPGDLVNFNIAVTNGNYRMHVYPMPSTLYGASCELVPTVAPGGGTTGSVQFIAPAGPMIVQVGATTTTPFSASWTLLAQT
jgi:hypothetical protein